MTMTWDPVYAEHRGNVGFNEGPNNDNPWSAELGIPNVPYCASGATRVPYHHGYRWWEDDQFGLNGSAYCPSVVSVGNGHGEWEFDRASTGNPCSVQAGDLLLYDWNGNGEADHIETAIENSVGGGRTHNIGYNTSDGVRDLWRDRRYLLGRRRPSRDGGYNFGRVPEVPGPGPANPHAFPGRTLVLQPEMMHGADVEHAQRQLSCNKGYPSLEIDGWYGECTARVVGDFQYRHELSVDFQLGPLTWAKLFGPE